MAVVYFGILKESSRSCSHLIGHDHSSSGPSSVPIAIARRPTADTNIPGRAGPVRASGESPRGKNGIVRAPLSNSVPVIAAGAPGARGGGSWARAGRQSDAAMINATIRHALRAGRKRVTQDSRRLIIGALLTDLRTSTSDRTA